MIVLPNNNRRLERLIHDLLKLRLFICGKTRKGVNTSETGCCFPIVGYISLTNVYHCIIHNPKNYICSQSWLFWKWEFFNGPIILWNGKQYEIDFNTFINAWTNGILCVYPFHGCLKKYFCFCSFYDMILFVLLDGKMCNLKWIRI